jgi:hypothetical protein
MDPVMDPAPFPSFLALGCAEESPCNPSIEVDAVRTSERGRIAGRSRRALRTKLPWAYTESFEGKGPEGRDNCN